MKVMRWMSGIQWKPIEITISPDEINNNEAEILVISSGKMVISHNSGCLLPFDRCTFDYNSQE